MLVAGAWMVQETRCRGARFSQTQREWNLLGFSLMLVVYAVAASAVRGVLLNNRLLMWELVPVSFQAIHESENSRTNIRVFPEGSGPFQGVPENPEYKDFSIRDALAWIRLSSLWSWLFVACSTSAIQSALV